MSLIRGENYAPGFPFEFNSKLAEEQHLLCFDQAKANLFWLVEPRIDTEGIEAARKNPIAMSIDQHMDAETRLHLEKLPAEFMRYWRDIDNGKLKLTLQWPAGYIARMERRAAEAQRRLLGREESGNVVKVNFRRHG